MCFSVCHLSVRTIESRLKRSQSQYDGDFWFSSEAAKNGTSSREKKKTNKQMSLGTWTWASEQGARHIQESKDIKQKLQHLNNIYY